MEAGEAGIALALAEALHAMGDERDAAATLAEFEARLLARADRIRDPAVRERFLTRVPENARTLELGRRWRTAERG